MNDRSSNEQSQLPPQSVALIRSTLEDMRRNGLKSGLPQEHAFTLLEEIERLRRERDDYCRQLTRGIPVVRDLTMERDRLRAALQEIEWYPARATFTSDPKTWMDMRDLASRALRPGDFPERRSDETEKNDG